jgi:hypothetical protein
MELRDEECEAISYLPLVLFSNKSWTPENKPNKINTVYFKSYWGYVARMGEKRNVYRLLVGKQEGKGPLGRPRRRWIDNIKMDLLEIGLNVVDWIGLAQDRYSWRALVNSVMNLRIP